MIRVDVTPFLSYSPIFVADARGYFRAEGLDVELVRLAAREALAAFAGGKLDVFSGQLNVGLFNAIGSGLEAALVADKGHVATPGTGCIYDGFVARSELLAEGRLAVSPALAGLKVSVQPHGILDFFLDGLLAKAGVARSALSVLYVDSRQITEAFRLKEVDLKVVSEPMLTQMKGLGVGGLWLPASAVAPGQQTAAIVFGPRLLGPERDAGRRFIAGYLRAVRDLNVGKTPALVTLIAQRTGLQEEVVREACWGNLRSDGEVDVPSVLAFQEWAKRNGALDEIVPAERFWDPSFVQASRKP